MVRGGCDNIICWGEVLAAWWYGAGVTTSYAGRGVSCLVVRGGCDNIICWGEVLAAWWYGAGVTTSYAGERC